MVIRHFLYIEARDVAQIGGGCLLSFDHAQVDASSAEAAYVLGAQRLKGKHLRRPSDHSGGAFLNDYVVTLRRGQKG